MQESEKFKNDLEIDAVDKKSAKQRVKVAIRVRPMIERQIINNDYPCVNIPDGKSIILGKERHYKFDHVFSDKIPQNDVYQKCVKDLTKSCFEGYNAAIMAYGQTGSGKTYTMGTASNSCRARQQLGIIPRVVFDIFDEVDKRKNKAEFLIKATFLQIYNQQILDLLVQSKSQQKQAGISIREQKDGSVSIYGINEIKVNNPQQLIYLLQKGGIHRSTSQTLMNSASSRSHAIFTITIEQHIIEDLYKADQKIKSEDIDEGFMTAKFVFVDLAGSQRAKKTGATGATLKQGININLGLLELGNVISALSQQKKDRFITYRNSKLTRILQDSLGGNSNTYMIACVSPSQSNFEQSLNTLKYASKAMNIKNKPIVNRDPHSALVSQLRQTIFELQTQNRKLRGQLTGLGVNIQQSRHFDQNNTSSQQLKKMKIMYLQLQKKYQQQSQQLKQQRKKKNDIEIQMYEVKRDRDYAWLRIQSLGSSSEGTNIEQTIQGKSKILEEYQQKITDLQALVEDKQKMNIQYIQQYQKLKKSIEKDEIIFRQKTKKIHNIKRQNKQLTQYIHKLHEQIQRIKRDLPQPPQSESKLDVSISFLKQQHQEQYMSSDSQLENDENYKRHSESFSKNNEQHLSELKSVDKYISEKQAYLNQMTQQQIELQYQLINEMKEQYYQKIASIQKQKNTLMQKHRQDVSNGNERGGSKYSQKIENLEQQLKQYRKKAKQQTNLQKMVNSQSSKLKQLANEIKQFKMQKIQLSRKIKQDKENFKKYKNQRVKEAIKNKKESFKQNLKIRKLMFENQRKTQKLNKRQEQIKRMKRINEAMKSFVKPKQTISSRKNIPVTPTLPVEVEFLKLVQNSIKHMLTQIDQDTQIQKYQGKIKEIQTQLQQLLVQQASQKLKLQRIDLEEQQEQMEDLVLQQIKMKVFDLKQRIQNCEDSLQFCREKYEQVINQVHHKYDVDSQIVFNSAYQTIDHLRSILKHLYRATFTILHENYKMKDKTQQFQLQSLSLHDQIQQLNQKIISINSEHEETLSKLRQEMMVKYYSSLQESEPMNSINNPNKSSNASLNTISTIRLDEKQRKSYEKKIVQLTKANRQIATQVQMWRRKCTIVQDKYNSMKNIVHKDKFIGIGRNRQQQPTMLKQKKNVSLAASNTQISNKSNTNMMEQVNQIIDNLQHLPTFKTKKTISCQQTLEHNQSTQDKTFQQAQFNKNKWECLAKIDAHSSAVLSLTMYSNFLISTANRSLKIWDIETNKLIADLSTMHLQNFVKHVSVHPERKIMAVACDKQVSIWDLSTLNTQHILKSHKDQIKYLHHHNNYLFSAGKGSQTGGALMIWDYRYLNPNAPLQEKQKNQDIFTMTSNSDTLYYGTRNHQVRRMNIQNFQILAPFQPPHMDTVTGLSILKNNLISGSKDKNLKLWSLNSTINNLKCTIHASNDYINCIQNDQSLPIFYSGSKDGQVKVGSVNKQKIQLVGGVTAHTQSVNAICPWTDTKQSIFATGSSDKTIRIWQPTKQTYHKISTHFPSS